MSANHENERGPPATALVFSLVVAIILAAGFGWFLTHKAPNDAITDTADATSEMADASSLTSSVQAEASQADSSVPGHNYLALDQEAYVYPSTDHSQNGGLVRVRYLGEQGGVFSLQVDGQTNVLSCTFPCAEVRELDGNQIVGHFPFSEATILGAAFTDAFNGQLAVAPSLPSGASSSDSVSAAQPEKQMDPG